MKTLGILAAGVLAVLGGFGLAAGPAAAEGTIVACDDEVGWPPYTYVEDGAVKGASAEIARELFRRAGYRLEFRMAPWKRCLAAVESGEHPLTINATHSEERARTFLLSTPYYSVGSALFYAKARFPDGVALASVAEMGRYSYCGMAGYNYSMYPIPAEKLDTGSKDERSRIAKLHAGRCDFVIGDREVLSGFAALGMLDLSGIAHTPIPGDRPKAFHMLISRAATGGEAMQKLVNDGLAAMRADGSLQAIMARHGM
ncbi:MAG TPA: transporter substrate-binding domain-containing protein [Alphaproteobacteria bacterium]|nr:transporter substrate-binding domain-containing protein [Alphaproteobacteria bacterium]